MCWSMPDLLAFKGSLSEACHYPEKISCNIATTLVFITTSSIDTHWVNHALKNLMQHQFMQCSSTLYNECRICTTNF